MTYSIPDPRELLDQVSLRYPPKVRELLMRAAPAVKDSLGEAPARGASDRVLIHIMGDNTWSMDTDELPDPEIHPSEVGQRKRLYERAVEGINGASEALTSSAVARKIEVFIDLINQNPDYVKRVCRERGRFEWTPVVEGLPRLTPEYFCAGNGTPLRQRMVESIASGLARAHWLQQPPFNLQCIVKYLLMTDAASTEGSAYPDEDLVRALLQALPENHQVYLLGLHNTEVNFEDVGRRLGISSSRIKVVPRNGKSLRSFLQLWSQSASEGEAQRAPEQLKELLDEPETPAGAQPAPLFGDTEGWEEGDFSLDELKLDAFTTVTTPANPTAPAAPAPPANPAEPAEKTIPGNSLFGGISLGEKAAEKTVTDEKK